MEVPVHVKHVFTNVKHESPSLHASLIECEQSPRHSKDLSENPMDLEIQVFAVWCPREIMLFIGKNQMEHQLSSPLVDCVL